VGVAVLDVILTYAKTLNELWSPAAVARIVPPESAKALDLLVAILLTSVSAEN
jgi:hypothetical protein